MSKNNEENEENNDSENKEETTPTNEVKELKHKLQIVKLELSLVGKYYNLTEFEEKHEIQKNLTDQLLEKVQPSE